MNIEHLKFPIGPFEAPSNISREQIDGWIGEIAQLPEQLRQNVSELTPQQLDSPYRPGGWTARQVIHHVADSHMNSYVRFKLTVTELNPTIRPYFEDLWAECEDAKGADPVISLDLLEALHRRWVIFLRSMTETEWNRTYFHPESKQTMTLKVAVALYAWHGKHHLGHILLLR